MSKWMPIHFRSDTRARRSSRDRRRRLMLESMEPRRLLSAMSVTDPDDGYIGPVAPPTLIVTRVETADDLQSDPSLIEDDPFPVESGGSEGGSPESGPFSNDLTFKLHSKPESNFTIYLDFDGHVTEGTSWNNHYGIESIVTQPYDRGGTPGVFTQSEHDLIQKAWRRAAEDFAPFDVNVTTEDPGTEALRKDVTGNDTQWGVRVVMTKDTFASCSCGGFAFLNSFEDKTDEPSFVFNNSLNGVSETISHEVGHQISLSHDGRLPSTTYYSGHGSGTTGWGAIMGAPFSKNITQWNNGDYFDANQQQDDLNRITTLNGFGYRNDDHGDSTAAASPFYVSGSTNVSEFGIIERNDDVDYFKFETAGGDVSFSLDPVGDRPNLDLWAGIYDSGGNLLVQSNPSNDQSASFADETLTAGTYYLKVDGVGTHGVYNPGTDTVEDPASPPWNQSGPVGYSNYGSLGQYQITGTIIAPSTDLFSINVDDAVKREGNSGTTDYTFTVTRSGDTTVASDVDFQIVPTTASAPGDNVTNTVDTADFSGGVFPTGQLNFIADEISQTITVTVVGDTDVELDEEFDVVLASATAGWALDNSTARGTILGDESKASVKTGVQFRWLQQNWDNNGDNFAIDNVSVSGTSLFDDFDPDIDSVQWESINGAVSNSTMGGSGNSLFFNGSSQRIATTNVVAADSGDVLSFDLITSNGSNGGNATESGENPVLEYSIDGGDTWQLIKTYDQDVFTTWTTFNVPLPTEAVADSLSQDEGSGGNGTISFTVIRRDNVDKSIDVDWSVAGFGANPADAADFDGGSFPAGTLSFAADEASKTIDIFTAGDSVVEPDETFQLTLNSSTGGALGVTSNIATIVDDDTPDVVIDDATVDESSGTVSVNVGLNLPAIDDTTLTLTTSDASANAAADYTATTAQVTILAGQTSATATFDVPILEDSLDEADETFTVSVQSVDTGSVDKSDDTGTVTITDNDPTPDVIIDDQSVDESASQMSFNVSLSSLSGSDVTLTLATSDGTATAGNDYTAATSQVTIPAGTTTATATFDVLISEDSTDEADETFTVSVQSVDSGTVGNTTDLGTGTITDNDPAPDVLISEESVSESATQASFAVTLSNPSESDITLTLTTADVSATAGSDYTATTGQVTIPAGTTTATTTFDVPILPDGLDEPDETFIVSVQSVDAGTVGNFSDTGTGTITDDDPDPNVTISSETIDETAGTASFAIGVSSPSAEEITLTLTTADLSATAGADYTATTTQVTILAGTTSATTSFDVPILDDFDVEGDETFSVSVQSIDTGTVGNSSGSGTGTITDDDSAIDPIQIHDDGDVEVTLAGSWGVVNNKGHENDFHFATTSGTKSATYTFDVNPGQHRISASWHSWSNRATDAPFAIRDGAVELTTVKVDQQQTPSDLVDQGTAFDDLGTFNIINNQLTVELTNLANGLVVADAIRIERIGPVVPGPEIQVTSNGSGIEDGTGVIDFGDVELGSTSVTTVTVTNIGTTDLTLTEPINVPAGFTVSSSFGTTVVAPFTSTTFDLQIDTTALGTLSGEVSFANDDSDENPFNFTAEGNVVPVSNIHIIDNGDADYATQGNWFTVLNKGHDNDFAYVTTGSGAKQATWTFDIQPGQYTVAATWRAWPNRATDAPYLISSGATPLATIDINQQLAPGGFDDAGSTFDELGTFPITGNQLVVTLADDANGLVVADAIRIERIGDIVDGPEIHVTADGTVDDGTGVVDMGDVVINTTGVQTINVSNFGTEDLILTEPISVPAGFTLASSFGNTTLTPGGSTSFDVQIDSSTLGPLSGEVSFANNDTDEDPFNFTIQGNIVPIPDIQIRDNGDAGFTLNGNWVGVNRNGHQGDFDYANSGTSNNTASWTFDMTPGEYRIFATWRQHGNRATDAPFTVFDGGNNLGTVVVNQQLAPSGIVDAGSAFQELGTFTVNGSQLTVVLNDGANGLVVADAIRIERIGP